MIDDIVTRLDTEVAALKLVGGAADFQNAAESNPKVTPAAFVIPLEDMPTASETTALVQRVFVTIGVVLVVRNVTDAKGVAAKQDLEALRVAVKEKLLGWEPAEGCDPLERGPGRLLAFRDGHMWWQDIYKTAYFDRSVL